MQGLFYKSTYAVAVGMGLVTLGCDGPRAQAPSLDVEPAASLAFVDVTNEAGLGEFRHERGAFGKKWMPETFSSGGGFIDYDSDGWSDVLLVGGGVWPEHGTPVPALQLYHNNRDGTFTRVTDQVGLGDVHAYGFGITAADYDNDADQDIFLSTLEENLLFRNDSGNFTEVGREAGIADHAVWSTAALFFDADRDGWLDLYVGNYVPWSPEIDKFCTSDGKTKDYCTPHQYEGAPGRFYRNNRDGTFTEWTRQAGLHNSPGKTLGVTELDFNNDGWSDFVVANDTQRNLLYRNNGDGTFTESGIESGLAFDSNGRARAGMGIDAGVLDKSGETSVIIGYFSDEMVGVCRHTGNGLFVDRSTAAGVGMASMLVLTFGVNLSDLDLDGDLDLTLANGHIVEHIQQLQNAVSYRQKAQLFLNDGAGDFRLISAVEGGAFDQELVARALSSADYDHDGDLDLLLTENGGPVHLWRNELNPSRLDTPHFLRLRLKGQQSNRDALGTRVLAVTGSLRQERRVRTGGSYLSQSETTITFGLGDVTVVDSLFIYWPSGQVEVYEQVSVDQELLLIEGQHTTDPAISAESSVNGMPGSRKRFVHSR